MDSTSGVAVETPTQAVPSNDSEADEVSYKQFIIMGLHSLYV